jgi:hypothetical protein
MRHEETFLIKLDVQCVERAQYLLISDTMKIANGNAIET